MKVENLPTVGAGEAESQAFSWARNCLDSKKLLFWAWDFLTKRNVTVAYSSYWGVIGSFVGRLFDEFYLSFSNFKLKLATISNEALSGCWWHHFFHISPVAVSKTTCLSFGMSTANLCYAYIWFSLLDCLGISGLPWSRGQAKLLFIKKGLP